MVTISKNLRALPARSSISSALTGLGSSGAKTFSQQTGCPLLINTSFNVRGEPMVCTAADAYRCFMATDLDVLVIERFVLLKREQPNATRYNIDEHLAQFELD